MNIFKITESETDKRYREWVKPFQLKQISIITAVTGFAYLSGSIIDILIVPEQFVSRFFFLHFFVMALGLFGISFLAYLQKPYKLIINLLFIAPFIGAFINIYLTSLDYAFQIYTSEVYLTIFWVFGISGLAFKESILAASLITFMFVLNVFFGIETSSSAMLLKLFWIASAYMLAFSGAFLLHRSNKIIFEQQDKLTLEVNKNQILLKELFHRVKNNLQIVSGILYMQSKKIDDERVKDVLSQSIEMIKSMGLIHEKIYTSENLEVIDFDVYLNALIITIKKSIPRDDIVFDVACKGITVSLKNAVPLGLILNEIITNSVKHAFDEAHEESMKISIEIYHNEDGKLCLKISDNGKGIELDKHKKNFGIKLIESLATYQLKASIEYYNMNGFGYTICFTDKQERT